MQSISVPVLILRIGVEFSLSFEVSSQLRFPWDQNSVNPVRLTAEVNILWFRFSRSNVVLKKRMRIRFFLAVVQFQGVLFKLQSNLHVRPPS